MPKITTYLEPKPSLKTVLLLALLPFAIKLTCMSFSVIGYSVQSLYKIAQLAIPIFWRRKVQQYRGWQAVWPIDQPCPSWRLWLISVLVAIVLSVSAIMAITFLAPLLEIKPEILNSSFSKKFDLTPMIAILVVAYLFTINAAIEELHFRAWLDDELSKRCDSRLATIISSAMFAGMHLFIFIGMEPLGPLLLVLVFAALFIAGIGWSLIAKQPGGIHAAWLSHGLTDAVLLTWGLFWLGFL